MSRAGDDGVEDAFPAKKHIFYTGNGLVWISMEQVASIAAR